jgi:hypothetical protein
MAVGIPNVGRWAVENRLSRLPRNENGRWDSERRPGFPEWQSNRGLFPFFHPAQQFQTHSGVTLLALLWLPKGSERRIMPVKKNLFASLGKRPLDKAFCQFHNYLPCVNCPTLANRLPYNPKNLPRLEALLGTVLCGTSE